MNSRLVIIVFLSIFSVWSVYGESADGRVYTFQDHHKIFGRNNISLSLSPIFANGLEVNYDRRIVERHWIKLAPVYFRKGNYRRSPEFNVRQIEGYGFKLQHKYFPYANTAKRQGVFLSYGPTFQSFKIETHDREKLSFDKFGLECVIGVRKVFQDAFYFEFYAGLASNYLKVKNDETENWREILNPRSRMWFDYGKTGNFMTFGVNIGVLF
jgi:hypothetical protein